jgi:hypothetical protein
MATKQTVIIFTNDGWATIAAGPFQHDTSAGAAGFPSGGITANQCIVGIFGDENEKQKDIHGGWQLWDGPNNTGNRINHDKLRGGLNPITLAAGQFIKSIQHDTVS